MKTKMKFIIPMLLSASFAANGQDLEQILSEAAGNRLSEQCTIELDTAENELKALLNEDNARGQDLYNSFNRMAEEYANEKREEMRQLNAEILSIQRQQNALKSEWNDPRTTVARREELRGERAELQSQKEELQTQEMTLFGKRSAPAVYAIQENNESLKDINIPGEEQNFNLKFPKHFTQQENGQLTVAGLGPFSRLQITNSGNASDFLYINDSASGAGSITLEAPAAKNHLLENAVIGGSKGIEFKELTDISVNIFNGQPYYNYTLTRWEGEEEVKLFATSEVVIARFLISESCQAEYDIIQKEHGHVLGHLPEFKAPKPQLAGVESFNSDRFSLEAELNLEPVAPIERSSQVNKN